MRISDWSSDVCSSDLYYYSEKRWAEDAALRVRALNIRRKLQGDRASDTLYAVRALAHSLAEDGRKPEATKILADVLGAWQGGATLTDAAERPVPRGRTVRSEERRVGQACVRTCRSRWSPYH